MKTVPLPDRHHLDSAEGWLGLGDHLSANEELDQITAELRAHPKVLELWLQIYLMAAKWEASIGIAGALVNLTPANDAGWIHRSFALHELKRTGEAYDLLLPAAEKFPKNWVVPYNLACYCSQMDRLEEAAEWFRKAMKLDEHTVKHEAIDDPDLQPLWDSMSGTLWKRE